VRDGVERYTSSKTISTKKGISTRRGKKFYDMATGAKNAMKKKLHGYTIGMKSGHHIFGKQCP